MLCLLFDTTSLALWKLLCVLSEGGEQDAQQFERGSKMLPEQSLVEIHTKLS